MTCCFLDLPPATMTMGVHFAADIIRFFSTKQLSPFSPHQNGYHSTRRFLKVASTALIPREPSSLGYRRRGSQDPGLHFHLKAPFHTHYQKQSPSRMGKVPPPEDAPFPLTDIDRWVLSQTDDDFRTHDWEELEEIVETNNLAVFKRTPSDLRRYMKWTAETKAEYGSMSQYLLVHRLPKAWGQPPFTPASNVPFEDPSDYRVLLNDWPYGLDPGITHIVVWLRTLIPTDPNTGDMTPESRERVRSFVKRYFVDALGPKGGSQVLWFKNWVALQSVRSLEHVHVLVRNVDDDMLERWTGERPKRSS